MELIDSKYTREKYKELGIEFTDWQKAAIIWNKPIPLPMCLNALKELAEDILDAELKKQIEERVIYEEKQFKYITQNPDNNYVYVVRDAQKGYDYGAFYIFDTALEHARKYVKEAAIDMCITKVQIVKGVEIPKYKSYHRWNPNLFPDKAEIEECDNDYSDGEVGSVTISVDGDIRHWWSTETTTEEDMVVDEFDKNRFESKFIKLPYVHEAGMIVKYTSTGEIGVLATGKEDWDDFMQRVDNGLYVDYSDKSHEVYSLRNQGYWSHDHICPFLIEKLEITAEVRQTKSLEFWQATEALSDYFSGNKSQSQEELVIRTARAYVAGGEATEIWDILW